MVALPSALFSFGHVKVPETVLPLVVIPIVHSPAFDRNATGLPPMRIVRPRGNPASVVRVPRWTGPAIDSAAPAASAHVAARAVVVPDPSPDIVTNVTVAVVVPVSSTVAVGGSAGARNPGV